MLGIDLSSTSVKILQISSAGDQYTVDGYACADLPDNCIEAGIIKNVDVVSNIIKKLILTSGLNSKKAAIAVPDSSAISKIIQVNEGLSDQEIEELVVMEADKYIPYPIDEINIDFNVIGRSSKNTAMLDVLIVASKAENVSNRLDVMNRAGLDVQIVDVESFAVERAAQLLVEDLPAAGENKNIAIIDIGALYTHLFVLHGMKIIYSREEEFGGKQLVDLIVQQYGMKPEDALLAIGQDKLPDDVEIRALNPFNEMMLLQLKRTLQFFFSTSHYTFVDHIVLSGGVAKEKGIATLIQEGIGVPTTIANMFTNMNFSRYVNKEKLFLDAPTLMIACGLALRRVE